MQFTNRYRCHLAGRYERIARRYIARKTVKSKRFYHGLARRLTAIVVTYLTN